jgi:hypothetical protein
MENSPRSHRRELMSNEEAYELCPPALRKALQDAITEWSSVWALRSFKKHGLRETITILRDADDRLMFKGFIPGRKSDDIPTVMSTYVAAQVPPLRLYDVDELVQSEKVEGVRDGGKTAKTRWVKDDGGRAASGRKGLAGDCVCRAIAIASGRPCAEVYDRLARETGAQRAGKKGKRAASARNGINTGRKWFKDYMAELGLRWTPTMKIGGGTKVHLRGDEFPMAGSWWPCRSTTPP